jgi:N6-L-threonylcarbamoyladenine synthase
MSWSQIDGIAVTNRPGLVGSLVVGISTAKSLSLSLNKPLIGVNHLEGHLLAPFLESRGEQSLLNFPYLALAVSGGHTTIYHAKAFGEYQILGTTRDDAAGEAFDKFAKLVGLGFPGGVRVDQKALTGKANAYSFPRSMLGEESLEMSFSGLKSAAHRLISAMPKDEVQANLPDLCASFQQAVVDVLIAKLDLAQKKLKLRNVVITGGVSANSGLRAAAEAWATENKINLFIPQLKYCTDNAAMIGLAGAWHMVRGNTTGMNLGPSPQSFNEDFC